tara:strand:+ start:209 stop:358 length:150 start_codon:yes stop_codon:yes gene_type:complete
MIKAPKNNLKSFIGTKKFNNTDIFPITNNEMIGKNIIIGILNTFISSTE